MTTFDIEAYLDSLPESITKLELKYRKLTYIPSLKRFKQLKIFMCNSNELTSLPELPDSLLELHCGNNKLENLPKLPRGLLKLFCQANDLKNLPELPDTLVELHCSNNLLKYLPKLPNGLKELYCSYNQLEYLPKLPEGLTDLICSWNRIDVIPSLPVGLGQLQCENNLITYMSRIPKGIAILYITNNPVMLRMRHNQFNSLYSYMLCIPQSDSSFDGTIDYKTTNYCKQKIQQLNEKLEKMNSWVHLYYCLKFRNQFRAWLWEKVREPRIRKHFHHTHLVEILEGADEYTADERVEKWINNYEGVSEDDI